MPRHRVVKEEIPFGYNTLHIMLQQGGGTAPNAMELALILPRILHVSGGMAVEGRRWQERAVLKKTVVIRKKGTEKGELK